MPIKGILYILFTHILKHSHTHRHTSSQRNYFSIMQTYYLAIIMLTMIPVHRGTATSPCPFFRVKPSEIPVTLMKLQVTSAVCALSAGGTEACFETAAFTTQLLVRQKQPKKTKTKRETENATHYIKGSHCHGDR